MIRILHSVSNMGRGGIETMLMNYYRHIDRTKVQFDFLCNKSEKGVFDDEILAMGGRLFVTPGFNPLKRHAYTRFMLDLFKRYPEYTIIEAHNDGLGAFALKDAMKANVPIRIYHAHSTSLPKNLKYPIKLYCKWHINDWSTHHFTCGIKAGQYFFGKHVMETNDFSIINNAIDLSRFNFNPKTRSQLRHDYNLDDRHVVGHVGRFATVKNHTRLLDIFAELKKIDSKATLALVGNGELMDSIRAKVAKLKLQNDVIFVGETPNPHLWYQAFDIFTMPSLYEGLPVVGIEAQTADLPCIFSSNVPNEIAKTNHCYFIGLNKSNEEWASVIASILNNSPQRKDCTDLIASAGYDIHTEARKLQNLYEQFAAATN
ncbi:MAG: glycosyltransferase family 1 protein [Paramuribaculum sp.]|nr:glycosyltransferase family 1 protein [Paramuribaculum sp.]